MNDKKVSNLFSNKIITHKLYYKTIYLATVLIINIPSS